MSVSIGFVLVTHEKPRQICRLIHRLNRMFDHPLIACHHDFAKCALQLEEFPDNVSFVLPSLPTGWGQFLTVEATMRAIRLLYERPTPPAWFVLLSGADYPIKPAVRIRDDLAKSSYDAHLAHELIDPDYFERDWQRLCYGRYFCRRLKLPRLGEFLLRRPFSPFSAQFRCYAGETWFCANRRAAEHILDFHATRPALARYYRRAPNPFESYYQCILANAPHLKLSTNHYRYVDWHNHQGAHPKTLAMEDLPQLVSSDAHFARKFDGEPTILNEVDTLIGD